MNDDDQSRRTKRMIGKTLLLEQEDDAKATKKRPYNEITQD